MQRSSTRFFGCLWQRPIMLLALSQGHIRCMAGRGSDDVPSVPSATLSSNTTRNANQKDKRTRTTTTSTREAGSTPSATHQGGKPIFGTMKTRYVMREDSMWRDPQRLDTKWLRARDSTQYKPDFKQTEPHSLRKQFMRSPDERTRDAMGRDWEMAMRIAANRRRQALLAREEREKALLAKDIAKGIGRHQKKSKEKQDKFANNQNKTEMKSPLVEEEIDN